MTFRCPALWDPVNKGLLFLFWPCLPAVFFFQQQKRAIYLDQMIQPFLFGAKVMPLPLIMPEVSSNHCCPEKCLVLTVLVLLLEPH